MVFICFTGSKRLTEAVEQTGRTYDEIGEMIAEQVCDKIHTTAFSQINAGSEAFV